MAYQEPDFLPWDGRRVPITFVGGYLGAGKTTAINALLAQADRPIAVLVNDVGEISLDARLIRKRHGDTIELSNGCVCCSLIDGFGAAFDQLRARETPPDHVVVELSGVADPARVLPWGGTAGFRLDGVVIVVAADQVTDDGTLLPEYVRETIEQQIVTADLLILTKTDVVDAATTADARRRLAALAPGVVVFEPATAGATAIGAFLALGGRRPGGIAATPGATLFDAHEVRSVSVPTGLRADAIAAAVAAALADVPGRVVRVKGVVEAANGEMVLVQVVGRRTDISTLPAAEFQAATDLTVITLRDAAPSVPVELQSAGAVR